MLPLICCPALTGLFKVFVCQPFRLTDSLRSFGISPPAQQSFLPGYDGFIQGLNCNQLEEKFGARVSFQDSEFTELSQSFLPAMK